jgi:tetraacyldisaccharide 4'-kinase
VKSTQWFPDHHKFTIKDFEELNKRAGADELVLMTEKDAVKCLAFAKDNWYVLPISALISDDLEQQIIEVLNPYFSISSNSVKEINHGI